MSQRADDVRRAYPLFQAEGGGAIPTSALQLFFGTIGIGLAVSLNRLWHSRLPVLVASNITRTPCHVCYAAEFDGLYYATAVWTDPIARILNGRNWLELRRFAIAPDAPKNTASRMLGWMVRDIHRRFPEVIRLISYQDTEVHTGTIYRASGWTIAERDERRSRRWNNVARARNREQSTATKERWEKVVTEVVNDGGISRE